MDGIGTGVAVYGALVGTASLAWNIYREVSNRGGLRIVVGIGNLHVSGPSFGIEPEPFQRDQLMFTVTNVGRRAIFLTQIGGGHSNGDYFMTPTPANEGGLPKRLEPGESFNDASIGAAMLDKPELQFLGAWDGENRIYKLPTAKLAELIAQRAAKKKGG